MSAPPTTVATYITESIRSAILEGRYPSGSRLDQKALAGDFGVSIIPVRESLRQLEAEGLVRIEPRRGAFVARPTESEVRELYRIRALLEAFATEEAVPNLERSALDELQSINDDLSNLTSSGADQEWSRTNRTWHFKLYDAAAAPLLMEIVVALWDRCSLTNQTYMADLSHRDTSVKDHNRILRAARRGDAQRAGAAMADHVRRAMVGVLKSQRAED